MLKHKTIYWQSLSYAFSNFVRNQIPVFSVPIPTGWGVYIVVFLEGGRSGYLQTGLNLTEQKD